MPADSRTLTVEVISDFRSFLALEPVWNTLCDEAGIDHPFLSHEWLRTWWECFGEGHRLHLLLVKDQEAIIAAAPFMVTRGRMYGFPVRRLQLLYNHQSPRSELIITRWPKETYHAIWNHLVAHQSQWDVVELPELPITSDALSVLGQMAQADGYLIGLWPWSRSPYLPIQGSWEDYYATLDRKHRSNLRNRWKRLSAEGQVELEVIDKTADLKKALADGFSLEAAAWKGKAGTAISSRPEVEKFYTRLACRTASRGWLRLAFLTLNRRRIAFQYTMAYGEKLYLLKPGYDPDYARYAPSQLLCEQVLRLAFEEGLTKFDFLGRDDPWKLEWTRAIHPHLWLLIFPNRPLMRFLYQVKFQTLPWLKRHWLYRALVHARSNA